MLFPLSAKKCDCLIRLFLKILDITDYSLYLLCMYECGWVKTFLYFLIMYCASMAINNNAKSYNKQDVVGVVR